MKSLSLSLTHTRTHTHTHTHTQWHSIQTVVKQHQTIHWSCYIFITTYITRHTYMISLLPHHIMYPNCIHFLTPCTSMYWAHLIHIKSPCMGHDSRPRLSTLHTLYSTRSGNAEPVTQRKQQIRTSLVTGLFSIALCKMRLAVPAHAVD